MMTLRGVAGELRYSYQLAGTVTDWTLTQSAEAWTLTATIGHVNTFRVSQRPLTFRVPHQTGV